MSARELLERLQAINAIIQLKTEEIERYKMLAESVGGGFGNGIRPSTPSDKVGNNVAHYVTLESTLHDEIAELIDERIVILSYVEKLPPDEYRVVMALYSLDLTLPEVSTKLNKSYSWVLKTRKRAMQLLEELLNEGVEEE